MNIKAIKKITFETFKDFFKNLYVIIPSAILIVILSLLSSMSKKIAPYLISNWSNIIWIIFYSTMSLLIISFFISGLIGLTTAISKKEKNKIRFFYFSAKLNFLKNFFNIILIIFSLLLVSIVSIFISKQFLNYGQNFPQILLMSLLFIGFAATTIFLTFSTFFTVIKNKSFYQSLRASIDLVKKEYIFTLSFVILTFIIQGIFQKMLSPRISELIFSVLLVPVISLFLTKFLILNEK